jgi:hypothetical protein
MASSSASRSDVFPRVASRSNSNAVSLTNSLRLKLVCSPDRMANTERMLSIRSHARYSHRTVHRSDCSTLSRFGATRSSPRKPARAGDICARRLPELVGDGSHHGIYRHKASFAFSIPRRYRARAQVAAAKREAERRCMLIDRR